MCTIEGVEVQGPVTAFHVARVLLPKRSPVIRFLTGSPFGFPLDQFEDTKNRLNETNQRLNINRVLRCSLPGSCSLRPNLPHPQFFIKERHTDTQGTGARSETHEGPGSNQTGCREYKACTNLKQRKKKTTSNKPTAANRCFRGQ